MVRGHISRGIKPNWKHQSFNLPGMKDLLILARLLNWSTYTPSLRLASYQRLRLFSGFSVTVGMGSSLTFFPWWLTCSWTYLVTLLSSFHPAWGTDGDLHSHCEGKGEMLHPAIMPTSRCCDAVVYSSKGSDSLGDTEVVKRSLNEIVWNRAKGIGKVKENDIEMICHVVFLHQNHWAFIRLPLYISVIVCVIVSIWVT